MGAAIPVRVVKGCIRLPRFGKGPRGTRAVEIALTIGKPRRGRMTFRKGTNVEWDWGKGTATGKIDETYRKKVTLTLKGSEITRNASDEEPAYRIAQDDGDEVLKSATEIRKA